jgi:hypothetical protein
MDFNIDLRLVTAQFHESRVEIDEDENVSGVLALTGYVDEAWREAFTASTPVDAPWSVEDSTLRFGPIPIVDFAARVRTLRDHIHAANAGVEGARRELAVAEYIAEERRERARREALDALGKTFGRRLSDQET